MVPWTFNCLSTRAETSGIEKAAPPLGHLFQSKSAGHFIIHKTKKKKKKENKKKRNVDLPYTDDRTAIADISIKPVESRSGACSNNDGVCSQKF